jgi:glycosyltransferase 2 family protein
MLPEFMKRVWLSHSKTISLFIRLMGTIVSTTLFIWLISSQKWDVVLNKAAGIAIWAFFLYLGLYLLSYGFNNLRWCILLWAQGVKISFWRAYSLNWAGIFASNFLPGTIGGDGFRMMAIHRYTGRTTISVGSVILDRIINMIAMSCLIPLPLTVFGSSLLLQGQLLPEGTSHPIGYLPATAVGPAASKGWLAVTFIPSGLKKLFEKYFPKIVAAIRLWGTKPWTFVYAFLAAWPSNLLPMAATYLIARQLGMNVTYWQVIGIQTVTYFLSILPISINGYGLREVAFTTLYTALGSSLEQASTLALVTRFLNVLSSLPGAIWLTSFVTGVAGIDKKTEA